MDTPAHSVLGPSAAHRWWECPRSARDLAGLGLSDEGSAAADEGTRAHEVFASILTTGTPPGGFDYDITRYPLEMINDAARAADLLRDLRPGKGDVQEWVEERVQFDFHPASAEERDALDRLSPGGVFGTADYVSLNRKTRTLYVVDFKYGSAIAVYPENNPQLICYEQMVLDTHELWSAVDTVVFGIIQPRVHGDKILWAAPRDAEKLKEDRRTVTDAIRAALSPDAKHNPGKACRFCPVRATCGARALKVSDLLLSAVPPADMDTITLAETAAAAVLIRKFMADVEKELLARLVRGDEIPGWKRVKKRAARVFKDGAEEEALLTLGTAAFETSLLSPAKLEKVPDGKAFVKAWTYTPDTGYTAAQEDDPREPLATGGLFSAYLKKD